MTEETQKPVPKYMKFVLGGSAGYLMFLHIIYILFNLVLPFFVVLWLNYRTIYSDIYFLHLVLIFKCHIIAFLCILTEWWPLVSSNPWIWWKRVCRSAVNFNVFFFIYLKIVNLGSNYPFRLDLFFSNSFRIYIFMLYIFNYKLIKLFFFAWNSTCDTNCFLINLNAKRNYVMLFLHFLLNPNLYNLFCQFYILKAFYYCLLYKYFCDDSSQRILIT